MTPNPRPTPTRRHAQPTTTDGARLRTRLRIALASVAVGFLLANITAYLIGRDATAKAARRTDSRVTALEQQVRQELNTRRAARDADQHARDAITAQFRRDACVLADRTRPRDTAVQQFRERYGCTTTPTR